MNNFRAAVLSALLLLPVFSLQAGYVPKWVSDHDPGSTFTQRTIKSRILADGSTLVLADDGGRTAVRFAANGTVLTKVTFQLPDSPGAYELSPFGEIYVAGSIFLSKFDGYTGSLMWATQVPLSNGVLALDPLGNPIVAYDVASSRYVRKLDGVTGANVWTTITPFAAAPATKAMTTDNDGNVFVTGFSVGGNNDFVTSKLLGVDGSLAWTSTYANNNDDRASHVAVDHSGNAFVVGTTGGTGTDIAVVKYNGSTGAELWRTTSTSPASAPEVVSAIAVDAENHLFIAGTHYNNTAYTDLQFMRYSPSGTRMWWITIAGTRDDLVPSIAVDGFGDILFTGSTGGGSFDTDLMVGKVRGSNGTRPWTQTYNRTFNQNDTGTVAMVAPNGDVYVAGTTYDSFTRDDILFTRYANATGSNLGMTLVDGNNEGTHYPSLIALGPANKILVAGEGYEHSLYDGATGASITGGGGSSYSPGAVTFDAAGNHYEAATFGQPGDYSLIKRSPAGSYLWQRTYNGPANQSDQPKAVTVDSTGKPIVSGTVYSSAAGAAIVTVKWDASGTQQWVHTFNGTFATGNDIPVTVLTDASDNVFVAGTAYNSGTGNDLLVVKINGATGAQLWAVSLNGGDDGVFGMKLDASGNPVVAARKHNFSSADFWGVKLDNATGAAIWNTQVVNSGVDEPHAIALDGAGDVVLFGSSNFGTFSGAFYTVKLNGATGAQLWTASYDYGPYAENGVAVGITSTNEIVGFGTISRLTQAGDDLALIRYTSAGAVSTGPAFFDSGLEDRAVGMVMIGDDPVVLGRNGDLNVLVRFSESLGIATRALPPAFCNRPYSTTVAAENGTPPYSFSITAGSLPPGLTLDPSTGVISGTAGIAGTPFAPRIRVTDATSAFVERDFRIDGFPGAEYVPIASTSNPVCGSTTLSVAGSWTSYLWQPNGQTTPTIAPVVSHPTLFGVKLGDGFSCTTLGARRIDVLQPLGAVTIAVSGTTTLCNSPTGGTATVTNTGGGTSTQQWGYRTTTGGAITPIGGQTGTSYVITASHFPGGGTYYLVCTTTPYCGTAATSNEIAVTISTSTAPSALTATPSADNQVALSWTAATGSGLDHYNIYRSNGLCPGGTFTKVAETAGLVTTWTDTNVINGGTYSYKVTAAGAGNTCETAMSNCDDAVAYGSCTLPPTFAGATSAAVSGCFLRVTWANAASNCPLSPNVVYNIHRSTTAGFTPGAANRIASCVTGNSWEDDTVVTGTTYYYVVRAEDSSTGGAGPCNGGNEDTNTVRVNATATSGSGVTNVNYADSFEAPNRPATTPDAYWIEAVITGSDHLSLSTCKSFSTNTSYKWGSTANCPGAYANSHTSQLTLGGNGSVSPSINGFALSSAQTNHRLKFRHWYSTESRYDGVALYYSTNGAAGTFTIVPDTVTAGQPYITSGVYNNTLYIDGGHRAWTGSGTSWTQVTVNLDNLSGQTVWFRWRYVTDSSVTAEGYYIDDVQLTADTPVACGTPPGAVQALTAKSTNAANLIEWQNPAGTYGSTMIRFRTDTFPASISDGTLGTTKSGTAGNHDSWSHTGLTNNTTYYYAAFVDNGSGIWSRRRTVAARPQVDTGAVKWAYATGATSVTRPGVGSVFAVANDRSVHAVDGGTTGGQWPSAWKTFALSGTSLGRPTVANFTLGSATKEVYVAALDGHVSCLDGNSGAQLWKTSSPIGDAVQGAANGMFVSSGGTYDLAIAGTRNASAGNSLVALDATTGSTAWTFDNGGGASAIGIISGDAAIENDNTVYFASRAKSGGSNHTLWALSFTGSSATKLWSAAIGDSDGSPAVTSTRVYVGTRSGSVYALDRATGTIAWGYAANDGAVKGAVSVDAANGRIYFATANKVWSVSDTGTLNWSVSASKPSVPLFTGTAVLFGSGDGKLYQLTNLGNVSPTSTFVTIGAGTAAVGAPSYDAASSMVYAGNDNGEFSG